MRKIASQTFVQAQRAERVVEGGPDRGRAEAAAHVALGGDDGGEAAGLERSIWWTPHWAQVVPVAAPVIDQTRSLPKRPGSGGQPPWSRVKALPAKAAMLRRWPDR
ncbi:MAG: hypothetical protein IPL61_06785 [Myxococcales bacterium]|nr:hypothetical protein [Myxococcales bacterium]